MATRKRKPWNADADLFPALDGKPVPKPAPLPMSAPLGPSAGLRPLPEAWRVVEVVGTSRIPVLVAGLHEWRGSERAAGIEAQRLRVQLGGVFEAEPVR